MGQSVHHDRLAACVAGDLQCVVAGHRHADEVHQVVAGEGQRQGEGSREDRDPHDVEPHPLEYPQDERRRGPEGEERQQDVLADILRDVGGDQSRTLETLEKGEVEDARERYAAPERAPAAECGVVAEREDEPRDVHEQRAGREGEDHGDQNGGDDDHGLARVDELREVVQREGGVGRDAEQRGGHGGAQQSEYHRHGGRGRKSQRVVEVEQQHVAQHHAQEEHHDFGEGELPGIEDSAAGDLHHAARGERADQDAGGGDPEDHAARGDLRADGRVEEVDGVVGDAHDDAQNGQNGHDDDDRDEERGHRGTVFLRLYGAKFRNGCYNSVTGTLLSYETLRRVKRNSSPPSSRLRTEIVPPWNATALRTIASPSPVPPSLRERPLSTR